MGKAVLLESAGSGGGVGKLAENVPQTLAGDPLSGGSPCSTAPTGSPQELCVLPTVVRLGVMTAWLGGLGVRACSHRQRQRGGNPSEKSLKALPGLELPCHGGMTGRNPNKLFREGS